MGKILGMDCFAYIGDTVMAAGETPADIVLTEIERVREVNTNLEAAEADLTDRGNDGWRATEAALRDGSVELDCIWDGTDTELIQLRDAYLGGNKVALVILDGLAATVGSQGFAANFSITAFNRGEPLEEGVALSITAKPASLHQWWTVPAP